MKRKIKWLLLLLRIILLLKLLRVLELTMRTSWSASGWSLNSRLSNSGIKFEKCPRHHIINLFTECKYSHTSINMSPVRTPGLGPNDITRCRNLSRHCRTQSCLLTNGATVSRRTLQGSYKNLHLFFKDFSRTSYVHVNRFLTFHVFSMSETCKHMWHMQKH